MRLKEPTDPGKKPLSRKKRGELILETLDLYLRLSGPSPPMPEEPTREIFLANMLRTKLEPVYSPFFNDPPRH